MTLVESLRYYINILENPALGKVDPRLAKAAKKAAYDAEQTAKRWGGPKPVRWNTSAPGVRTTFNWSGDPKRELVITTATKTKKGYTSHVMVAKVDKAGDLEIVDAGARGLQGPHYSSTRVNSDPTTQIYRRSDSTDLGNDSYYGKSEYERTSHTQSGKKDYSGRVKGHGRVYPTVDQGYF